MGSKAATVGTNSRSSGLLELNLAPLLETPGRAGARPYRRNLSDNSDDCY
jgi:hypothetical protein